MPEAKRYVSLPVSKWGSAMAVGYWYTYDGGPKFALTLFDRDGARFRLLTLDEVAELKAACSKFLADVDIRRMATGESCSGKGDCRCTKCTPLSEL